MSPNPLTCCKSASPGAAEGEGANPADGPPNAPITYQLVIEIPRRVRIAIGALGACAFPPGRYIYTGSARRNLEARIARHLARRKTLRWHIDHLLNAAGVRVVDVHRLAEPECVVNQRTAGEIVVPRFGASDCRAGCGSHLKRV